MLIPLKCDQVTILDRNTCKTYNVSYLIIHRYFRRYIIWDLTTATLNNLLDFFLNFFICARYFFSLFFSCANIFLVFAQPSPQKFNGPFLRSTAWFQPKAKSQMKKVASRESILLLWFPLFLSTSGSGSLPYIYLCSTVH